MTMTARRAEFAAQLPADLPREITRPEDADLVCAAAGLDSVDPKTHSWEGDGVYVSAVQLRDYLYVTLHRRKGAQQHAMFRAGCTGLELFVAIRVAQTVAPAHDNREANR